jgi:carboxylesterase
MSLKTKMITCLAVCSFLLGCSKNPPIEDRMMDGNMVFDPSLYNPEQYLISKKYPNPTAGDLEKHIILAIHGYSASTFEWSEFQEWSRDSGYRISQVLLDGHGRTYNDFKASHWQDWGMAIKREYEALEAQGYKKISCVGSSTGGTLLLELVKSNYFSSHIKPLNLFLIDPVVVPSAKLQSLVGIIGPMIVYVETDQSGEEDKFWYRFRPYETINELNKVIDKVRKGLERGYSLPQDTYLKLFHSKHDPTANSLSAVLIYKGLTRADGSKIDVQIMNSDIHVFTRLKLRSTVTELYLKNQEDAFRQIAQRLNQ